MTLKSGYAGPATWPCCGVSAVATAVEVPFATVFEYMRQHANYDGKWKGSSTLPQRLNALKHLGAATVMQTYLRRRGKLRFWQWALLHAKPHTTYLVDIPGHTVVFRDMMVIDQARPEPTHFALLDRIGSASITHTVEILSIPTMEERMAVNAAAVDDLSSLF